MASGTSECAAFSAIHLASAGAEAIARTSTLAEAEAFALDPANPAYHGDVAHQCRTCGWWHLSRPEWLAPGRLDLTTENATVN